MNFKFLAIPIALFLVSKFAGKADAFNPATFDSQTWPTYNRNIPYNTQFFFSSAKYGVPQEILAGVARNESNFNPSAVGAAGEQGMMQFMPATAKDMGVQNPFDPEQAIDGAAKYLNWLQNQTGDWFSSLVAYNWGIGNVLNKGVENAPTSSKNYAISILEFAGRV